MSQGALVRSLGVSKGTATHWLAGTKRPALENALAIERLLGIAATAWAPHMKEEPAPAPP